MKSSPRALLGSAPRLASLLFIGGCVAVASAAPADARHRDEDRAEVLPPVLPIVISPLVWSVVGQPVVPVRGSDGRWHVVYELFFVNLSADTVRIHAIETVDPARGDRVVGRNDIVDLLDADVSPLVRRLASKPGETTFTQADYADRLGPARSGLHYVNLAFRERDDIPHTLANRVTMSVVPAAPVAGTPEAAATAATAATGASSAVPADAIRAVGAPIEIGNRPPIVLGPPLRGDRWLDGDGCCRTIGPHRYTLLPIAGSLHAGEHFAIDFVQLDAQGRLFTGDGKDLRQWPFYGADVIAAAGGRVVQRRDGLPDQVPGTLPADATADSAAGNYVIVDMGDGAYALYAHMIPGSVEAQVGQTVARGERLGRLGNSGNSDGPHLHFQVMNSPSALETVGLPFVFDRMQLQGRAVGSLGAVVDTLTQGRPATIDTRDAGLRRRQMPLSEDLLGF